MPRHNGHTQPVTKNRRQSLRPAHNSDLRQSWGDDARSLLQTSLAMADRGQSIIAGEAGTGEVRLAPTFPGPWPKDLRQVPEGLLGSGGERVETVPLAGAAATLAPAPAKSRPNPKTRKRRALAKKKEVAS
jgi:hypothetical protein